MTEENEAQTMFTLADPLTATEKAQARAMRAALVWELAKNID